MSETKSLAAPKTSFDRRAVVKGAAWSVPVIAAAIAAPAAAASVTPATLSAALVPGSGVPTVGGTPEMHGTGPKGFAVTTTGVAVTGAISVVIDVQPDAAATAAGVGLAVTAAALPPSGQSSPYNFAYSRTGSGNSASNAVLKYTVTVTVTVVESATKKTVLPAMVFVATLEPVLSAGLVLGTPTVSGSPETLGTGSVGVVVSTTGASVPGTISVDIVVTPKQTGAIGLGITASAQSVSGPSSPFSLAYKRTGTGTVPVGTTLLYGVSVTVTVTESPTKKTVLPAMTFEATLKKKN
jgi:hypothetical protein